MFIFRFVKEFEYFVRMCTDVLLELLLYGNRNQLIKLEYVGRHFHHLIENFFVNTPIHRLNMRLELRFLSFAKIFSSIFVNNKIGKLINLPSRRLALHKTKFRLKRGLHLESIFGVVSKNKHQFGQNSPTTIKFIIYKNFIADQNVFVIFGFRNGYLLISYP